MFYTQNNGATVISDRPVSINGEIRTVEIPPQDFMKIQSGLYDFSVVDGEVAITEKPKTEKEIIREEMRAKLDSGSVTTEDIVAALKLLI